MESQRPARRAKGRLVALAPCKPRQRAKTVEGVTYPCPSCHLKFSNAQALGGHQNAHRKEREEEERQYRESRRACREQLYVPRPPDPLHTYVDYARRQPDHHVAYGFLHPMDLGHAGAVDAAPEEQAASADARPQELFDFMGEKEKGDDELHGLDLNLHL